MRWSDLLLELEKTLLENPEIYQELINTIIGSVPAVIGIIFKIICKLPGVVVILSSIIMKLANWRDRKILDSVLLHGIKDESTAMFIKRIIYMALDAFSPFVYIFITAGLLIAKVEIFGAFYSIGKWTSVIWFVFLFCFASLFIIGKLNKTNSSKIVMVKWIILVTLMDVLVFNALLMLDLKDENYWFVYFASYISTMIIFELLKEGCVFRYNALIVRFTRNIRTILLILLPVVIFKAELVHETWIIGIWVLIWYIEYGMYIFGVGIPRCEITLHTITLQKLTQKWILQCKGNRIKYFEKDGEEKIVKDNEVEFISYELHVKSTHDDKVKVLFTNEEVERLYNSYRFLNEKWIALNRYEDNKKYVEVYKIDKVERLSNAKNKRG